MAEIDTVDTQYRSGLIVPDFEVGLRIRPSANLRGFFSDIFDANGTGWPTHDGVKNPTPYLNEIVVPGSEDKPSVVIRENFTTGAGRYRHMDSLADPVTYATNEKSILVAPSEGSLTWRGLIRFKEFYFSGYEGYMQHHDELGPEISLRDNNRVNRRATEKYDTVDRFAVWNRAIKNVLHEFVELVSN